jgi:hypothetical protein
MMLVRVSSQILILTMTNRAENKVTILSDTLKEF